MPILPLIENGKIKDFTKTYQPTVNYIYCFTDKTGGKETFTSRKIYLLQACTSIVDFNWIASHNHNLREERWNTIVLVRFSICDRIASHHRNRRNQVNKTEAPSLHAICDLRSAIRSHRKAKTAVEITISTQNTVKT